jgi:hypothetical protein
VKGRIKFCRPIFRAVSKVDYKLAVDTFGKSKQAFHPIARKLIEKVNGLLYLSNLSSQNIAGPWIGVGICKLRIL